MSTISERIKYELDARGWTPYKLAKLSKISQPTILAWFKPVPSKPNTESLKAVAKAFGIKTEDLLSETVEADPQKKKLLELWNRLGTNEKNSVLNVMEAIINHNR